MFHIHKPELFIYRKPYNSSTIATVVLVVTVVAGRVPAAVKVQQTTRPTRLAPQAEQPIWGGGVYLYLFSALKAIVALEVLYGGRVLIFYISLRK